MAQMIRVRTIARLTAYATPLFFLMTGGVLAQSGDSSRKIVVFQEGTPVEDQINVVKTVAAAVQLIAKVQIVAELSLSDSLVIVVPSLVTDTVLGLLRTFSVVEVVLDDIPTVLDGNICIAPGTPPPSESYGWGLQQTYFPEVHQQWTGVSGTGVTVAVLDTGIDPSHIDLTGRIAKRYNARAQGDSSADDNGHGTHVAGIIAAVMNTVGLIGGAPQVTFASVKVLDAKGAGYLSEFANGLEYVHDNGFRLVNMSVGFQQDNPVLRRATERLHNNGVIMVAAAGNRCAVAPKQDDGGGDECDLGASAVCDAPVTDIKYPAAYTWVLAVGATDKNGGIPGYVCEGEEMDLVAPGGALDSGKIFSTNKGGSYGWAVGTSQATAHVTAAVALALQRQPELSFKQVRSLLRATATNLGYEKQLQGAGRLNVRKMVEAQPWKQE
jgi:subtilisin family serine protease